MLKFNIAPIDGHLSVTLVKQLQRQLDVRYLVRILCISQEKQRDFEHVLKDVKHNWKSTLMKSNQILYLAMEKEYKIKMHPPIAHL